MRVRALAVALLVVATSCSLGASFFVANLSTRTVRVEFRLPCRPDCPVPTFTPVDRLRRASSLEDVRRERSRAVLVERQDSTVTYSVDLPPDTAVHVFDGETDGAGTILYPTQQLRNVRITVDTGQTARSYEGRTLGDAFRKWHDTIRVLEIR
jgi:hypothetical protein